MASMMGCLGVWVTDTLDPLVDCLEVYNYESNKSSRQYVITPSGTSVIVEWPDESVKSYIVEDSQIVPARMIPGLSTTKMQPSNDITGMGIYDADDISGLGFLSHIENLALYDFGFTSLTIPDGLDNLDTLLLQNGPLETLTLNSGNTNIVDIQILECPDVTSVTLPSDLVNLETLVIDLVAMASFTTHAEWVSISSFTLLSSVLTTVDVHHEWVNLQSLQLYNGALTEAAVNDILTELDLIVGLTGAEIDLSDGTSAAPTGAGAVAKASLIVKGNTVTTN